jgi:hypothetical protein
MSETRPGVEPQGSPNESDLELLAIEAQFIAEYEAGAAPRLATYALRYPDHAQALAAFVTAYLSPSGELAEGGAASEEAEMRRAPGPGTQRALDAIFGAPGEERRVAEQGATYTVGDPEDGPE